jgi:hypothetical protein
MLATRHKKPERRTNLAWPKPVRILTGRIRDQGLRTTFLWALDHAVRIVGGAPIRALSQITPQIHLVGQLNMGCCK